MSVAAARLERLMVLVPFVLSHPGVTVSRLTEEFAVSRSELIADLELLMMCGLPEYTPDVMIEFEIEEVGGEEVVRLRSADYLARPVTFTVPEAFGLLLALRLLRSVADVARGDSLASVEGKIVKALGVRGGEAEELARRVQVSLDPSAEVELRRLIWEAVREHRQIEIDYYTAGRGRASRRRIDPHRMVCALGLWYVVAFCHQAGEMRVFRLDRVGAAKPIGVTFEPQPDFDAEAFGRSGFLPADIARAAGMGAAVHTTGGESCTACIKVDAELAPRIREAYPGARVSDVSGGGCVLSLGFEPERARWLVNQVMAWAPHAEVIEPVELRRQVRDSARVLKLRYS